MSESEEKTASEIMMEYKDENKMFSFEGSRGLKSLTKLCEDLGYSRQVYADGSPLEEFLRDNPACIEAIFDWVEKQLNHSEEWKESLSFSEEEEEELENG